MRLSEQDGGETVEVTIPDLSGETFSHQWERRQWTREYSQFVRQAAGALLFIHPAEIEEPMRIDHADPLIAELGGDGDPPENGAELKPWDASRAPTQVKLIELVQFMSYEEDLVHPFRIAVVVSAWDLVADQGRAPSDWVQSRLPLLSQFLLTNSARFPSRMYGISAQGGDLGDDRDELLRKQPSVERIQVVGDALDLHDITAPIKWLIH